MMAPKKEPPRTQVDPHDFDPDPDPTMVEYLTPREVRKHRPRRRYCRVCKLPGEPGDDRHPLPSPDPEIVAAALERDAEILGERPVGGEG